VSIITITHVQIKCPSTTKLFETTPDARRQFSKGHAANLNPRHTTAFFLVDGSHHMCSKYDAFENRQELLPVACCLLPAACCLLPAACCLLPAACCLLPAAF
jgi:hypothetical protein